MELEWDLTKRQVSQRESRKYKMLIRELIEPWVRGLTIVEHCVVGIHLLALLNDAVPEIFAAWWKEFDCEPYDLLDGLL
jgi:hypothetical protein